MPLRIPNDIHIGSTVSEISRLQITLAGVHCGRTVYPTAFKFGRLLELNNVTMSTKRHPSKFKGFRDIAYASHYGRRAARVRPQYSAIVLWRNAVVARSVNSQHSVTLRREVIGHLSASAAFCLSYVRSPRPFEVYTELTQWVYTAALLYRASN